MREPTTALALPEPLTLENEPATHVPYRYPEFCGPGGERYLKKLLRQILPMALYRTWEIFADHQAKGNDCYLSLFQLAQVAGRSLRTMQKNIASLQARHLLVERVARKVFHGPDGDRTRMVVIKDFDELYALAHEYHGWLHQEAMIPPERAFVAVIFADPELVAKLRRFDNYRRLFSRHVPDPEVEEQEEDRWLTESRAATHRPQAMDQEPEDPPSGSPALAPKMTAKALAKDAAKTSLQRINETSHRDERQRDSFDSAPSFSEESWRNGETAPGQIITGDRGLAPGSGPTRVLERTTMQAGQGRSRLPQERPAVPNPPAQRTRPTRRTSHHPGQRGDIQAQDGPPRPPDHPLARSFLTEIAAPFGDRNPKGSLTRVLRILAQASCLQEAEVLLCLVRAATIARETRTLRPAHYDQETGQANRMPLFCTLVERFVQARLQHGKWNYSWQQMEEDLAADDRLLLWWSEHQELVAHEEYPPETEPSVTVSREEKHQETPETAAPPIVGWTQREAAHTWGEQLLIALLAAGYEAEVRVHREDPWYQLVLRSEGQAWVLQTPEQVQDVIARIQQGRG